MAHTIYDNFYLSNEVEDQPPAMQVVQKSYTYA